MIHPTRPIRRSIALVGVAGALALSGCAATADTADADASAAPSTEVSAQPSAEPSAESSAEASAAPSSDAGALASVYAAGTYTASGAYQTPSTVEEIEVTITLEGDIITAVEVVGDPSVPESRENQAKFIGGIADAVVGQKIDDIEVTKVAGSSLTSGGFNKALEEIRSEAAA